MPIFPSGASIPVSTSIPVQTNQNMPLDPQPKQVEALGGATERTGTVFATAERKKREMIEDANVLDRGQQAVKDMEDIHDTISNDKELALNGKENFDKMVQNKEKDWYAGLNGREQFYLQHTVYRRQLEYQVGAAKLENRAVVEKSLGALDNQGKSYIDVESRRLDPSDAQDSPEFEAFKAAGEKAVSRRELTPQQWVDKQQSVLSNGAYSRAHRIIASDSKAEVQHLIDIANDSEGASSVDKDKTFLRNMAPEKRSAILDMAKERLHTLEQRDIALKNQAYTDTHRQLELMQKATDREAALRMENPGKYGPLSVDWIERMGESGLLEGDKLTMYRNHAEAIARSGSPDTGGMGNPGVINRYSKDVFNTRSPEHALQLRSELEHDIALGNVPAGPNSMGSQWLSHLTTIAEPKQAQMTIREKTKQWRTIAEKATTLSGPGATMITDQQRAVHQEIGEMFEKNMFSENPVDPADLYNQKIANWQSRLGRPASSVASELARSSGIAYSPKGDNTKSFSAYGTSLEKQYKEAPPGPAGDAVRSATLEQIKAFRKLQQLDTESKRIQGLKDQAKGARETQKSEQPTASGPLTGPRK